MIHYLLDTNVVSELSRPAPRPGVLAQLDAHDGELAVSAVTMGELRFGVDLLPPSKRRDELEEHLGQLMRRLPVLPYDRGAALWHGAERARLRKLGKERPFVDGQIAAVAATRNLILVTANVADFAHFDNLIVKDWTQEQE